MDPICSRCKCFLPRRGRNCHLSCGHSYHWNCMSRIPGKDCLVCPEIHLKLDHKNSWNRTLVKSGKYTIHVVRPGPISLVSSEFCSFKRDVNLNDIVGKIQGNGTISDIYLSETEIRVIIKE